MFHVSKDLRGIIEAAFEFVAASTEAFDAVALFDRLIAAPLSSLTAAAASNAAGSGEIGSESMLIVFDGIDEFDWHASITSSTNEKGKEERIGPTVESIKMALNGSYSCKDLYALGRRQMRRLLGLVSCCLNRLPACVKVCV